MFLGVQDTAIYIYLNQILVTKRKRYPNWLQSSFWLPFFLGIKQPTFSSFLKIHIKHFSDRFLLRSVWIFISMEPHTVPSGLSRYFSKDSFYSKNMTIFVKNITISLLYIHQLLFLLRSATDIKGLSTPSENTTMHPPWGLLHDLAIREPRRGRLFTPSF